MTEEMPGFVAVRPAIPPAVSPVTTAPTPPPTSGVKQPGQVFPGAVGRTLDTVAGVGNAIGDAILPQTGPQAAFAAGAIAAGPIVSAAKLAPLVSRLTMPLARIILGAVSEGAATAVQGAGFMSGVKQGVTAGAIGEGIGMGLGLGKATAMGVAKRTPIMGEWLKSGATKEAAAIKAAEEAKKQTYQAAADAYKKDLAQYKTTVVGDRQKEIASNVGQFLDRVPPLSGIRNADQLEAMARERQPKLGQYFENRIKEATAHLGPDTTLRVPALATGEGDTIMTQYGPMPAALLGLGNPSERMTLPEAAQKLTNLRVLAYGGAKNDPTTRTIAGLDSRKLYGQALQQIDEEIRSHPNGDQAIAAWTDGRHAMAVGSTLIDLFQKKGLFLRSPGGASLDSVKLQGLVRENSGWLKERMGPDDFKALTEAVYPGGKIGQADILKGPTAPQLIGGTPKPPTAPVKPMPAPMAATPPTMDHPVNIPRIMIDSAVQRMLPQP